jgi:hypothetical protein
VRSGCVIVDVVQLVERSSRKKDPCGGNSTLFRRASLTSKRGHLETLRDRDPSNVMIKNSSRLAHAAQFISKDEFLEALSRIWPRPKKPTRRPDTLGMFEEYHKIRIVQTQAHIPRAGNQWRSGFDGACGDVYKLLAAHRGTSASIHCRPQASTFQYQRSQICSRRLEGSR